MDIGNTIINFPCPECEFLNSASLHDVEVGASLICVGCLKTIQLSDGEGSTKRSITDVNNALNELGDALNGN